MLDEDRLWRVVPSDALQATAIAQLLTSPEAWDLPPEPTFVLVHKQGAYGEGLKNELVKELAKFSTGFGAQTLSYPDPNEYLADVSKQWPCWTRVTR